MSASMTVKMILLPVASSTDAGSEKLGDVTPSSVGEVTPWSVDSPIDARTPHSSRRPRVGLAVVLVVVAVVVFVAFGAVGVRLRGSRARSPTGARPEGSSTADVAVDPLSSPSDTDAVAPVQPAPPVEGKCSAGDALHFRARGGEQGFHDDLKSCSVPCLGGAACTASRVVDLGYSESCAGCWGDMIACAGTTCIWNCIAGDTAGCRECCKESCIPSFDTCTGFSRL